MKSMKQESLKLALENYKKDYFVNLVLFAVVFPFLSLLSIIIYSERSSNSISFDIVVPIFLSILTLFGYITLNYKKHLFDKIALKDIEDLNKKEIELLNLYK